MASSRSQQSTTSHAHVYFNYACTLSKLIHTTAYQAKTVLESVKLNTDQLILDYNNTKTRIGGEFCKGDMDYAKQIREQTDIVEEQILAYKLPVDDTADQAVNDLDHIILVVNEFDNQLDTASRSRYFNCRAAFFLL